MFDSKKMAEEIMKTFNSLEEKEQQQILSNCGLSFQKKQQISTKKFYKAQNSANHMPKTSTCEKEHQKKELAHC